MAYLLKYASLSLIPILLYKMYPVFLLTYKSDNMNMKPNYIIYKRRTIDY